MKILNYIRTNFKLRILVPLVIFYLIVSVIIYIILINSISNILQQEFASKGRSILNAVASSVQDTILNNDPSAVQAYIEKYRDVEGISFIIIMDEHKKVLAHTFYPKIPDEYLQKINNDKLEKTRKNNDEMIIDEELIDNKKEMVLSRPILNGLLGHIYMGMGIEKREKEITLPFIKGIVIVMFTCVVITIAFTSILLNIILRPILDLTRITQAYANGNQNIEELQVTSEDEVGKLTKSFYLMMKKITENKNWLEQEVQSRTDLINTQQLSMINSSKMSALGEMAGGIAHEINTPLAIIGMKIEQMHEGLDEKDITVDEMKTSLDVIKATTDRIAKIINGLRFFARDGSHMSMEKTDLDTILEDTFSFCSEKMRMRGVQLDVIKNSENKMYLNCRPVEISQVLLNLLNNATDAVADQKEKWIRVLIREFNDEVEISVIDNGPGIPKHIQEKIMQPFFTTKEVGKGTGLGLSISRGIIDSHHGKFYIDSDFLHTTFTVVLPKYKDQDGISDQSA